MTKAIIQNREALIREACNDLANLLVAKNSAYGDSILSPINIISDGSALEKLEVRIDDKLSRIIRGDLEAKKEVKEETDLDLAGYFLFKYILSTKKLD